MKRFLCIFMLLFLLFSATLPSVDADNNDSKLAIVFSHDLHSHIEPFMSGGNDVGGFARIKTIINYTKSEYNNTIVVDAGDFSMGTLYQSVFESAGSEYSMLGHLGYDAITFGNHEFDYGFDALCNMINSARAEATSLPPILCSNIDTENSELTETKLSDFNIREYSVFKKGRYSMAVFGLLGRDAVELSSSSGLVFEDYIEAAKNTVAEIKNLYSPDMIICLSHSGTGKDVDDEDVKLAEAVPDIDIIVSGHTHSTLSKPIIINNTYIVSCGEYGERLGEIIFDLSEGKPKFLSYNLHNINNTVAIDNATQDKITHYKDKIGDYLNRFGYDSADELLAYSPFDFPEPSDANGALSEQQLGNLISDSYIYAVKKAEGDNYVPIDVAVAPYGVIRSTIDKGNVTVSKVFEISSLGIGKDGVAGYPLCSVYLYGRELWDLAEVDASVSSILPYAQLYCSGLRYSVNTNRMFLNKVYDCWLVNENGTRIEIEDDKLYRVVSGKSSALLLGTVKDKSFGLLEITPKDANGNEITDFDKHIAIDTNGAEVKEWKALADYVSSFPANSNGVPEIPMQYAELQGRKNVTNSFAFSELFTNWNMLSWSLLFVILLFLTLILWLISSIIKKVRKNKRALITESEDTEILE